MIGAFFITFAGNGLAPTPESKTTVQKQWLFTPLAANDVSLELERLDGNVLVYLFSQRMKNVEVIYVEKSRNPYTGFTRCKTIKVVDHLLKSKNYISVVDDAPFDSNIECYYRIRTLSSSGATKMYPVVSLAPIMSIEPETVDNSR